MIIEPEVVCIGCHKLPEQIPGCVQEASIENLTPDEWVRKEDGTYNRTNGHFYCTACYVEMGTPLGKAP